MEKSPKKHKKVSVNNPSEDAPHVGRPYPPSISGTHQTGRVPSDVWRYLLLPKVNLRTLGVVAQMSRTLKAFVEELRSKNYAMARAYRCEGQIRLARKYLLECAEDEQAEAMFQLGYAYAFGGWGLKRDNEEAENWLQAAWAAGSERGEYYYYKILPGQNWQDSTFNRKRLSNSNDDLVRGLYFFKTGNVYVAHKIFLELAKQGDEFAQYQLGILLHGGGGGFGTERNVEDAVFWFTESAKQGFYAAQFYLSQHQQYQQWCTKAVAQRYHKE